jgi:hypothetical protein
MVLRWFRVWVAITMGAFATGVVNSATVHYDGDTILGVSGLVSRGETYNVEFKDGSCASLFSGCDSPSDFAFFDSQQAVDAIFSLHSALAGADDTRVRGCGGGYPCTRYTPFFTPERYFSARDGGWIEARFLFDSHVSPGLGAGGYKNLAADYDTSASSSETFVIFTPVPEVPAWALMPAGLLLLCFARRSRPRMLQGIIAMVPG